MIEGSSSQLSLNHRRLRDFLTKSATELARGNDAVSLSLTLSPACNQCSRCFDCQTCPHIVIGSPHRRLGPFTLRHPQQCRASRRVPTDASPISVRCFDASSQFANVGAPGPFRVLWYGWVSGAPEVTSSSVQQCFCSQVSTFSHFSLQYATPHLSFRCPTLVLVTLATVLACPQLVKNCAANQLMTHEVRELSGSLVWSGLSLTMVPQVSHPPPAQLSLASPLRAHSAVVQGCDVHPKRIDSLQNPT